MSSWLFVLFHYQVNIGAATNEQNSLCVKLVRGLVSYLTNSNNCSYMHASIHTYICARLYPCVHEHEICVLVCATSSFLKDHVYVCIFWHWYKNICYYCSETKLHIVIGNVFMSDILLVFLFNKKRKN